MQPRYPYPPGYPYGATPPLSGQSIVYPPGTQGAAPVMYTAPPTMTAAAYPAMYGAPPAMYGVPPTGMQVPMMYGMPPRMPPHMMPSMQPLPAGMRPPPTFPPGWAPTPPPAASPAHNPVAMVPLAVYIGRIPGQLENDLLRKIFEVFGKVLRWNRPIDSSLVTKAFGFVTFEHALCALRCVNVLGGIDITPDGHRLVVRVGTKETAVLESLVKWEAAQGMSVASKDKEETQRQQIVDMLARPEEALKQAREEAVPVASVTPAASTVEVVEEGLDEEDVVKQRLAFAEIEKFRVRQAARDKENAVQRRSRLEARSQLLRENHARMAAALLAETAKAEAREKEQSEKRVRETAEEAEDSKRRRREVAALVQGSSEALEASQEAPLDRTKRVGLRLTAAVKAAPAAPVSAVFAAAEEEESRPQRSLVPLDYSEEERRETREAEDAARKRKQKELVDLIPTDRATLFAYPVDWEAVRRLQLAETSLRPWIVKKMVEYLGQEERTLSDFIIAKVSNRCNPLELLAELEAVLDEDAEQFVIKLWRMLIFTLIAAANA